MRTPTEYTKNLKEKTITAEMLDGALWSVNKRAKNWRDKKREYRSWQYDMHDLAGKAECNEQEMYAKKDALLKLIKPICIHEEFAGYERIRVYDYQDGYAAELAEHKAKKDIVHKGSYVVPAAEELEYLGVLDAPRTYFFDYEDKSCPKYRYYLYYKTPWHSYHSPVSAAEVEGLMVEHEIPAVRIEEIETCGNDISELLSMQFVDKLLALVKSGDYVFDDGEED